ncbi:PREDICTED: cholesterol 7-desaturase [Bactrocera latifrons]|uniref:cholesterol 7-desaturase n=1 Tax=Bactrocera latifrons TaxID=174628 RepID=UPI0008DCBEBE|nr:PREDICTED: cholesterol 7-desaturase [Bactrocera latifrons]
MDAEMPTAPTPAIRSAVTVPRSKTTPVAAPRTTIATAAPRAVSTAPHNDTRSMAPDPPLLECALCRRRHRLPRCGIFKGMTPQQRQQVAQAHGHCLNCLAPTHRTPECTTSYQCQICMRHLHTLLHRTAVPDAGRRDVPRSQIPENGADFAHFSAVHQTCLLVNAEISNKSLLFKYVQHRWEADWSTSPLPKSHVAVLQLTHYLQMFLKYKMFKVDIKAKQVGPSFVHLDIKSSILGHIDILQTVTPIEPLVQKVSHRFYARRGLGPMVKLMIFAESVMFERDMFIWNHKVFRNTPILVKEDIAIKKFRMWFSQFYTENSISFIDARKILDW